MIYLAGPMSGHKSFNHPKFNEVEEKLAKRLGDCILNPVKSDSSDMQLACMASLTGALEDLPQGQWEETLALDIADLMEQCDTIVLLPGWEHSRGARLEAFTALTCDMLILQWDDTIEDTYSLPFHTVLSVITEGMTKYKLGREI